VTGRYVQRLVTVMATGLALAPVAAAHGPTGGGATGYISTVDGLKPPVLGVLVKVLGGDDRLRLANYSQKTVLVLGYEREPFLRFTSSGVYENTRSPAAYLSRVRDPAQARVPTTVDPAAPPLWRKVTKGQSYEWHDHRIHWTKTELPAAVHTAPDKVHLISRWKIPARSDGKPFSISGFLGYVPPPGGSGGGGTSPWLLAAVIATTVLVAAGLVLGARRTRRRAP
jgi:hypothetical protein